MRINDFSLKSKLLMMVLGVALLSTLIVGIQGLYYGKVALTERVYEHLTSVRETKEQQIKAYFRNLRGHIEALALDHMTVGAMREFSASYQRLGDAFLDEDQLETLENYYQQTYLPRLSENVDGEPLLKRYLPRTAAARYLQYHYIAASPHPLGQKADLVHADDHSYYSAVHKHYHPAFKALAEASGYYDLFLIDIETGHIVYSVGKETDYATGLKAGPNSTSNLGRLYQKVRNSQDRGDVQAVDFDFYRPSYGQPAAFAGITIFDEENNSVGILAIQISTDRINRVMTGDQGWREQGLGETGEAFLMGEDGTMRSDTRLLMLEDGCYRDRLTSSDETDPVDRKICGMRTSILLQRVDNTAARRAGQGQTGEMVVDNYAGVEVLSSFAPLPLPNVRWTIIAEMATSEINAPIRKFQRELTVSVVLISCLVTLIAMRFASRFTQPLSTIMDSMRQLRSGDLETRIELERTDEYGDLAAAFNRIIKATRAQSRLIEQKKSAFSKLLRRVLPESAATRFELGDEAIVDRAASATVICATLDGFNQDAEQFSPERAAQILGELVGAWDKAASRHGIERIKTLGGHYLAVCGLTVTRLDHVNRSITFARSLLQLNRDINKREKTRLTLHIGLETGPVSAGLIGKQRFSYDIWGQTVDSAGRIALEAPADSIVISQELYEKLDEQHGFKPMEPDSEGRLHWHWTAGESAQ